MPTDLDMAVRFAWMERDDVRAKDTPHKFDDGAPLKTIIFDMPCKHLCKKGENYSCGVYDKERPDFCGDYPDSVFLRTESWNTSKIKKLLQTERELCPALKQVKVKDIVEMLKRRENGADGN